MAATNINRVVITGNLTRDPELRTTRGGTAVCSLRVAVNTRRKDQSSGEWVDKPNYFDVTVWGQQGENCAQYLAKGRPVAVDGRLEWREWQDQTATSGRRWISLPTPSSSSAPVRVARTVAASRRRATFPPIPGTSSRRRWPPGLDGRRHSVLIPTREHAGETLAKQRGSATRDRARTRQGSPGRRPAQVVPVLPGQGRRRRLQGLRRRSAVAISEKGKIRSARVTGAAGAISASSPAPSSAPGSSVCCRTSRDRRRWPRPSCSRTWRPSARGATSIDVSAGLPAELPRPAQARPARHAGSIAEAQRRMEAAERAARGGRGQGAGERRSPVARPCSRSPTPPATTAACSAPSPRRRSSTPSGRRAA